MNNKILVLGCKCDLYDEFILLLKKYNLNVVSYNKKLPNYNEIDYDKIIIIYDNFEKYSSLYYIKFLSNFYKMKNINKLFIDVYNVNVCNINFFLPFEFFLSF